MVRTDVEQRNNRAKGHGAGRSRPDRRRQAVDGPQEAWRLLAIGRRRRLPRQLRRQEHAHGVAVDPVGRLVLDAEVERIVVDVGLGERVRGDVDAGRARVKSRQLDAGTAGAARSGLRRERAGRAEEAVTVRVAREEAVDEAARSARVICPATHVSW